MTLIKTNPTTAGTPSQDDPTHTGPSQLGLEKQEFVSCEEEIKGYLARKEYKYVKDFLRRYDATILEKPKLDEKIINMIAPHLEKRAELIVPLVWTGSHSAVLIAYMDVLSNKMQETAYRNAIKTALTKPQKIDSEVLKVCHTLHTLATQNRNKRKV